DVHVSANRNPLRRYARHFAGSDPTIVEPRRLRTAVSSDVCGQCHSVWSFSNTHDEAQAASVGLAYRPGDTLARTRFLAQPSRQRDTPTLRAVLAQYPTFLRDSFWSDGMIRVSGREYNGLIDSPCFANATNDDRRLSCFSCHTLHKASTDSRSNAEWAD